VREGEREADRLFPFDAADDGPAVRLARLSSGASDSSDKNQLPQINSASTAAAAERLRSLPLLRMLLLATQQHPQQQTLSHPQTRTASSASGSSLIRGYRRQWQNSGTTRRMKRMKPQHDITGTGTLRYL